MPNSIRSRQTSIDKGDDPHQLYNDLQTVRPYRSKRTILIRVALIYPSLLLLLSIIQLILPQRAGTLALLQIVAPYLFIPLLPLALIAFMRDAGSIRLILLVCAGLFWLRFLPLPHFLPPHITPTARQFTVMNWNVHVSRPTEQADRVAAVVKAKPADIVTLEETYWRWMEQDPVVTHLYPYRLRHTEEADSGLVLLSAFPILEHGGIALPSGTTGWPRVIWARLDLGAGRTLVVITAHPESPYGANEICRLPCYDPVKRDTFIRQVRTLIDPVLQRGDDLLVLGDFNTTDREPAYTDLAQGLQDAHRLVGAGLGHTWGLDTDRQWQIPVLRIDYLLSSPRVIPVMTSRDCTLRGSDHCILQGSFAVDSQP